MKKNVCLILVLAMVLVLVPSCKKNSSTDEGGTTVGVFFGNMAPNFVETTSEGATFSFDSFKGKVILLSFSAMWCGPCKLEAAHLMELYNKYKEQGLEIVQVVFQDEDGGPADQSDINRWMQTYGLSFTCITDADYSTVQDYSVGPIPTNLVIDRDFIIRYRGEGFDPVTVEQKIQAAL